MKGVQKKNSVLFGTNKKQKAILFFFDLFCGRMQAGNEKSHQVTDNTTLYNLHVYPLKRRYYGYENIGDTALKEYTRAEVEAKITAAFANVFVDSTLNSNTSIVVVPDNWDRHMPASARGLKFQYVPFVYVLHPGISGDDVDRATAPNDAAVQFANQQANAPPTLARGMRVTPAIMASPAQIERLLRTRNVPSAFNTLRVAPAPQMESTPVEPATDHVPERPRLTRRSSINKRTASMPPMMRDEEAKRPTRSLSKSRMQARDQTSSRDMAPREMEPRDRQEYSRAWEQMRTRAAQHVK